LLRRFYLQHQGENTALLGEKSAPSSVKPALRTADALLEVT
jgi:hypothetical protein